MRSLSSPSRLLVLVVVTAALAGGGCASSSDRSRVSGEVRYGGEPVDDGGIAFIPEEGSGIEVSATGPIEEGHYDLDYKRGPFPGKYRVEIYWDKKTGKTITSPSGSTKDERKQAIPDKYNEKTELRVEVKPGRNTLDFDLQP